MPGHLYLAGDRALLHSDIPKIAVIGTRHPTKAGRQRTRRLVRELVEGGVCVVSGLAAGVDALAHETAMSCGGRTIAVAGLPLDQVYPKQNARLQERIAEQQLLVSQFAPGARTSASFFVQRNRTMAILAHGTVIIEASDQSGTLSQASSTLHYGKPLFILKSAFAQPNLHWPEAFSQRGARTLVAASQILQLLGLQEDCGP